MSFSLVQSPSYVCLMKKDSGVIIPADDLGSPRAKYSLNLPQPPSPVDIWPVDLSERLLFISLTETLGEIVLCVRNYRAAF